MIAIHAQFVYQPIIYLMANVYKIVEYNFMVPQIVHREVFANFVQFQTVNNVRMLQIVLVVNLDLIY